MLTRLFVLLHLKLQMCKEEGLKPERLQEILGDYIYTEKKLISDEIIDALEVKP